MDYLVLCAAALLASGLTLFSGFGLGTLLLPVFACFFPLPVAVAATALVHLANNLFKLGLLAGRAHWPTALRLTLPAALGALAGAWLLGRLALLPTLGSFHLGPLPAQPSLVKLTVGGLILLFAGRELFPGRPAGDGGPLSRGGLLAGGLLSGFLGGLSGHQGALRAAVLRRAGLDAQAFVATGVVCAVVVDCVRLAVYGLGPWAGHWALLASSGGLGRVAAACLAAFLGAYLGKRLLGKATHQGVRLLVGGMLALAGLGLVLGLL